MGGFYRITRVVAELGWLQSNGHSIQNKIEVLDFNGLH